MTITVIGKNHKEKDVTWWKRETGGGDEDFLKIFSDEQEEIRKCKCAANGGRRNEDASLPYTW